MNSWTVRLLLLTCVLTLAGPGKLLAQYEQVPEPDPPRVELSEPAAAPPLSAPHALAGTIEWTYHKTADNAHPNGSEQQLMWLMNRARANPPQEGVWLATMTDPNVAAARTFWGVDTVVLQAEFAAYAAKPPAAFDVRLYNAAKAHCDDLIARDAQDHTGQFDRIDAAGFVYTAGRGNVFSYSQYALYGHAAFNIDWGPGDGTGMQPGRGHRMAIMSVDGDYANVGIAAVSESNAATAVGPQVITGNYCHANTAFANHYNRFIVGTVWTDGNANSRYDPGEGIAGVSVIPDVGDFFAVTADSGGYAIPITAAGTYEVSFSGSSISGTVDRTVAVGTKSVLLDLQYAAGSDTPEVNTAAATSITSSTASLNGTVNANGTNTTYYFEYGQTAAYGDTTGSYSTSANSSVAITVTGLTPATTYHFRLVANNSNGTSYGADRSFQTASAGGPASSSGGGGGGGGGGGACFVSAAGRPPSASADCRGAALWLFFLGCMAATAQRFALRRPRPAIR